MERVLHSTYFLIVTIFPEKCKLNHKQNMISVTERKYEFGKVSFYKLPELSQ